ncbi:hypothetical protein QBC35DRAFT_534182 [Podospora australis]|uniref:C2H2-type domain-containing protein n=1 Tax=Podospora australis TaxID=1536484 RepID=A0AAN6WSA9_9PEZI|nr:hypothetical protein QBC35DRAFT_534182 [Podospora australis]
MADNNNNNNNPPSTPDPSIRKSGRTPLPSSRTSLQQQRPLPSLPSSSSSSRATIRIAPRPAAEEPRSGPGSGVGSSTVSVPSSSFTAVNTTIRTSTAHTTATATAESASANANPMMPLHPKPPNSDTTGALHSYQQIQQQQQQQQRISNQAQQRRPLPGSPAQSYIPPPRFQGTLPGIKSLLPPSSSYSPASHSKNGHHGQGPLAAPPAYIPARGPLPPETHGLPIVAPYNSLPPLSAYSGNSVAIPRAESAANQPLSPLDKPHKCTLCTQAFSRNHDLKRHKRIHELIKPFPCSNCSKTFSRKDALKRHQQGTKACNFGSVTSGEDLPSSPQNDGEACGGVEVEYEGHQNIGQTTFHVPTLELHLRTYFNDAD